MGLRGVVEAHRWYFHWRWSPPDVICHRIPILRKYRDEHQQVYFGGGAYRDIAQGQTCAGSETTTNTKRIFATLLFIAALVMPAMAYYNPTVDDLTGSLFINVRCRHNLISRGMVLTNNIAPRIKLTLYLRPDGFYDDRFIPGDYTLVLLDGNAGQPETQSFSVVARHSTFVSFIGHAVSMAAAPIPEAR